MHFIFTKTNIESIVYISVIKRKLRILILKESREKRTFSVSNICYFRNLAFWDWFPLFQNDPPLLANHPLFTQNVWCIPSCDFWEGQSPLCKRGVHTIRMIFHEIDFPCITVKNKCGSLFKRYICSYYDGLCLCS